MNFGKNMHNHNYMLNQIQNCLFFISFCHIQLNQIHTSFILENVLRCRLVFTSQDESRRKDCQVLIITTNLHHMTAISWRLNMKMIHKHVLSVPHRKCYFQSIREPLFIPNFREVWSVSSLKSISSLSIWLFKFMRLSN